MHSYNLGPPQQLPHSIRNNNPNQSPVLNTEGMTAEQLAGFGWYPATMPIIPEYHVLDSYGEGVLVDGYVTYPNAVTHDVRPEQKEANLAQIAAAGKAYIESQIDPDGLILVNLLYTAGHPYGVANFKWGARVRLEQMRRQSLVESGTEDFAAWMTDFSEFGDKDYTVEQMAMAANLPDLVRE